MASYNREKQGIRNVSRLTIYCYAVLGLAARLAESLPPAATTRNPVDLAGGGEQDTWSFERVARQLLESSEVDAVVLTGYFGGYGEYASDFVERELMVARALGQAAAETERPVVVHTMYPSSAPAAALRKSGVPVYRTTEAAVGTIARLAGTSTAKGEPRLPAPRTTTRVAEDYWGARELLASAGIPLADARRVSTLEDARAAARDVGYPLVVKAAALLH